MEVVAPVVVLLLEHVRFRCDEWSPSDISALEELILKRLLGQKGGMGSKNIGMVLGELLDVGFHPSADKECHWVDPTSGGEVGFSLQHAVNFAYHVDGGFEPVPSNVGESFCRPPERQAAMHSDNTDGSVGEAGGRFDHFTDDDETPQGKV
jgi:hypothetical protein